MIVGARWLLAATALCLAGCSERPQISATSTGKKADAPPWATAAGTDAAYAAPGWKGGDQAAWAQQIHQRAQAQNDYVR